MALRESKSRKLSMNGTAIKQIDVKIEKMPKNNNRLWEDSINRVPKAGTVVKQAKVTPADFADHINEIA